MPCKQKLQVHSKQTNQVTKTIQPGPKCPGTSKQKDATMTTNTSSIGLTTEAADQIAAFLAAADGRISAELRGKILVMMIEALRTKTNQGA
tara:strand:+ start:1469 stop:1741 length:273 start_codon:yes stop_codon:yes gene_type:complete